MQAAVGTYQNLSLFSYCYYLLKSSRILMFDSYTLETTSPDFPNF